MLEQAEVGEMCIERKLCLFNTTRGKRREHKGIESEKEDFSDRCVSVCKGSEGREQNPLISKRCRDI